MKNPFLVLAVFRRTPRRPASSYLSVAFLVVFLVFLLPGLALAAADERTTPGNHPVPDSVLAGMRGGFSWGGMDFSFGIESSTFVNGTLMVKTILQTVGDELYASTGVNPFGSGTSTSPSPPSPPSPLLKGASGSSKNLSGFTQTSLESAGTTLSASTKSFSPNGEAYSNVVQIQPGNPQVYSQNLIAPSAFDNASGIISVLQNAASNLVIHNVVTMNGTVSNVKSITHALSLNSMLQASRFLNR